MSVESTESVGVAVRYSALIVRTVLKLTVEYLVLCVCLVMAGETGHLARMSFGNHKM